MASASLTAASRTATGKGVARKLRAAGKVPAVVYGHARAPQSLALETREVERLLERIVAASTVVDLAIDGTPVKTLIREIQRHPSSAASCTSTSRSWSPASASRSTCRSPSRAPRWACASTAASSRRSCTSSASSAIRPRSPRRSSSTSPRSTIGHPVHARDIALPAGVTLLTDADVTVVMVSAPRRRTRRPGAPAEPEVIRKAKADDADAK
jgi:large subunit ribosomal protein L25